MILSASAISLEGESIVCGSGRLREAHASANMHIYELAEASLLVCDVHVQRIILALLEILHISLIRIAHVILRVLQLDLIEASALTTIHVSKLVLVYERLHLVGTTFSR